jgi:hypothetical protein
MKQTKKPTHHATVVRVGFTVPLIGIPKDAVLDECQMCGRTFPLNKLSFSRKGRLLCKECGD